MRTVPALFPPNPAVTTRRAEVAQLVEHSPEKAGVDSSILSLGTIFRILGDSDSLASGTQVAVTGT